MKREDAASFILGLSDRWHKLAAASLMESGLAPDIVQDAILLMLEVSHHPSPAEVYDATLSLIVRMCQQENRIAASRAPERN